MPMHYVIGLAVVYLLDVLVIFLWIFDETGSFVNYASHLGDLILIFLDIRTMEWMGEEVELHLASIDLAIDVHEHGFDTTAIHDIHDM